MTPISQQAMTTGFALPLLAERMGQPSQSFSWHADRVSAVIAASQSTLTFDRFGQLCGYVSWAQVSPDVNDRLLRHGTQTLAPEEILSGSLTWIIDLCAMHGELNKVLADLRDRWLGDADHVTYFRVKHGRRIAKRVSRLDRTSFFSSPSRLPNETPRFLTTSAGGPFLFHASNALDAALTLGELVHLAKRVVSIGHLPLSLALSRLCIPMRRLQHKIYRDRSDRPSGFLSWAWLDVPSYNSAPPAPHLLATNQWNEGCNAVLQDAFGTPECLFLMAHDLDRGLVPGEQLSLRTECMDGRPGPIRCLTPADASIVRNFVATHGQPIDVVRLLSEAGR